MEGRSSTVSQCFLIICLLLVAGSASCVSRPVEEVVTTDAGRVSALPAGAEPQTREPNLPNRYPDLETAGDRIGEAITYLDSRRRDRREVALRALTQAQASLTHLQSDSSNSEINQTHLKDLLRDLDNAMRAVSHNSQDASKLLTELNKRLDSLEVETTENARAEGR